MSGDVKTVFYGLLVIAAFFFPALIVVYILVYFAWQTLVALWGNT